MLNKLNCNLSVGLLLAAIFVVGCSPVEGPRYWWDDQTKEKLANDYMLPESPPEYPVPTDPAPYVPKGLPDNEVQLATEEEKAQIKLGIPRAGDSDPLIDRVVVPAEKYEAYTDQVDEQTAEMDYVAEGVDESQESFSEAAAADSEVMNFAEEEKAVDNSAEAKDFIDEMSEDYNYNFNEEGPAGEDYSYKDDPTPSDSLYEKEEVETDAQNKIRNIEGEMDPAVVPFE